MTSTLVLQPTNYSIEFGSSLTIYGLQNSQTIEGSGIRLQATADGLNNFVMDGYNSQSYVQHGGHTVICFNANEIQCCEPLRGATSPLLFASSGAIALSHGGTTSLSAVQSAKPMLQFTDSGLTENATVVLPTTAGPAEWTVDLTGINFGGRNVTLSMGTAAKMVTISTPSVIRVYSDGAGRLFALTYT
jgi:hypothetical protein